MDLKYLATKWDEKEILSTLSNEKKCHDTCEDSYAPCALLASISTH